MWTTILLGVLAGGVARGKRRKALRAAVELDQGGGGDAAERAFEEAFTDQGGGGGRRGGCGCKGKKR